jgi:hypothetical protein
VGTLEDGFVYGRSGTTNYLLKCIYPIHSESDGRLVLPDEIGGGDYTIYKGALDLSVSPLFITIPDSVSHIEEGAFGWFEFYDTDGVTELEPTAENLRGCTFAMVFKDPYNEYVKQKEPYSPPSLILVFALLFGAVAAAIIIAVVIKKVRARSAV